ncbi:MAG: hypothetical protein AVDCRST_MAG87-1670 [uncultured Thermomicrobiales bacterium]|uniref:Uncharacterized protein n=1 Tax=uncultured Thermomicrobiales bacterium TaxID=1645740 RepID=A0A6J4UYP6_9BACT|nr:MAG: hypothetical protein AVDCRST_MAG87-1670 [uncultured Thermomicrobiales bacterium]
MDTLIGIVILLAVATVVWYFSARATGARSRRDIARSSSGSGHAYFGFPIGYDSGSSRGGGDSRTGSDGMPEGTPAAGSDGGGSSGGDSGGGGGGDGGSD